MTKLVTAIAVATGILLMPNMAMAGGTFSSVKSIQNQGSVIQVKETRRNGRGVRKHRKLRKKGHGHHNRHRHAGGHFFFDYDYYGDHAYRSCRYLKRKARYSGSRYWWKKYRRCMNRHYY